MMKKYINALLSLSAVALLALGSCSKETPFGEGDSDGVMGSFRTSSLKVSVNPEENVVRSQADDAPELSSFTVAFYKEGETSPEVSYIYSELPEIVTLPVGTYSAVAYSGENADAIWDVPYYEGRSASFDILADKVTEVSEPVVARLSAVKVTILFDKEISAVMSPDSKVTVTVGDKGSLVYTKRDENRHGYFAYVSDSHTLAAHFEGIVEGYPTSVAKAREDVQSGNHYIITFRLRSAAEGDPGILNPSVEVDATVEVEDVNGNVIPEDSYLEDDMRPVEGGDEPDDPNPPVGDENGPTVSVSDDSQIDIDKVNDFYEGVICKLLITSKSGVKEFTVDIDSPTLTPDELTNVGLRSHLDLVNPGELRDALEGLGFPVAENVKDKKEVIFDISDFGGLLCVLGPGEHKFVLTVKDADGTTVKTLRLRTL